MKKIFKYYGLPKTGTNVLHHLLCWNFNNYVCSPVSEHGVHFLGWKHGLPPENVEVLEDVLQEDIMFVLTRRSFESWENSIKNNHMGSWEFPLRFNQSDKQLVAYNTPCGLEFYLSFMDLYTHYTDKYMYFAYKYPEKFIIVDFEDFSTNQEKIVLNIKEKFSLELMDEKVFKIRKKIDSDGVILDTLVI